MIRVGTVDEAHSVFLKVPEFDKYVSIQEMRARLGEEHLVIVAENGGRLSGFKIGYPESDKEFYSWLGGVVPEYRHSGITQRLLEFQEAWARTSGFKTVSVKSMNKFPSMLRLLIKNGYQITRVDNFGSPQKERIRFIKALDNTF